MFWTFAVLTLLNGLRFGGTFIGAVICEDGIVVASDSRSTLVDKDGKRFAYVDGMPKIFVDDGAAVAVAGMTNVEGELFSTFVQRNDYLLKRPVNEILFGFLVWLPFSSDEKVSLFSAGYVEGKPMICVKPPVQPQQCATSGYLASKDSPALRALNRMRRLPTSNEAAEVLKIAIEEQTGLDPTVGGPVSILKLSNGSQPEWIQNKPADRGWKTMCDLINAHRRGQVSIVARESQQEVDRRLRGVCRENGV